MGTRLLAALARLRPRRPLLRVGVPVLAGAALLATLGGGQLLPGRGLEREVEELLQQGQPERARQLLLAESREEGGDDSLLKLQGDVACARGEDEECLRLYQRALAHSSRHASDERLWRNTLERMNRADKSWLVAQVAAKLEDVEDALVVHTQDEHYWKRWNAVRALEARGQEGRISYGVVYGLDVLHAGTCSTRQKALEQLSRLQDAEALPYLEQARKKASAYFFGDTCLGGDLERVIRQLSEAPSRTAQNR